jgi:hypothetical protein
MLAARLKAAVVFLCFGCVGAAASAQMQDEPVVQVALQGLPDAPMAWADAAEQDSTPAQASTSTQTTGAAQSGTTQQITPSSTGPADAKQKQKTQADQDLKAEEKQRLLGIMPQFQLVSGGTAVPLTGKQKFDLALHSAIDPFYIGWAFVVGGGWGEVVDSNKGYGWGDQGYFERVGANYADNVDGAVIGNALLPAMLHQDPRYFRVGTGSFGHRFLHAALSTVVCKGDNGNTQANVSNVLGNFIAGGISNLYYPKDERGAKLTAENGTSVTLFGALGGQFLEFGPDINRLVHHKKAANKAAAPSSPAAAAPADPH